MSARKKASKFSRDEGESWRLIEGSDGKPDADRDVGEMIHPDVHSITVHPTNADRIVFGPADGVSRNGRIEESRDGGRNWQPAAAVIQTLWPRHMVERLVQVADELVAVLSNGELWATVLSRIEWRRILPDLDDITAAVA
ncbi:MAG: hypothetical protein P8X90_08170 [Desulfobacterales bacterium]